MASRLPKPPKLYSVVIFKPVKETDHESVGIVLKSWIHAQGLEFYAWWPPSSKNVSHCINAGMLPDPEAGWTEHPILEIHCNGKFVV